MNAKVKKELESRRESFINDIEAYRRSILKTEGAIMLLNELLEEK